VQRANTRIGPSRGGVQASVGQMEGNPQGEWGENIILGEKRRTELFLEGLSLRPRSARVKIRNGLENHGTAQRTCSKVSRRGLGTRGKEGTERRSWKQERKKNIGKGRGRRGWALFPLNHGVTKKKGGGEGDQNHPKRNENPSSDPR